MWRIGLALILWAFGSLASAQSPVVTTPYAVTSSNNSSTVAVTNTFQSIWAANTGNRGRAGCTLQNNGTNNMRVFFGPITNATANNSIVMVPGAAVYCQVFGIVLQDQVSITGTSGDAFFAAQQ